MSNYYNTTNLTIKGSNDYSIYYDNSNNTSGIVFYQDFTKYNHIFFKLPKKEMPYKVFVCGKMTVLGSVGTAAEVIYAGSNKLFIKGDVIGNFLGRISVIVEYEDSIYNYTINATDLGNELSRDANICAGFNLVSKIELKKPQA